jgi:hypothetical protein
VVREDGTQGTGCQRDTGSPVWRKAANGHGLLRVHSGMNWRLHLTKGDAVWHAARAPAELHHGRDATAPAELHHGRDASSIMQALPFATSKRQKPMRSKAWKQRQQEDQEPGSAFEAPEFLPR